MGRKRASFRSRDIGGPPKDQTWCWYTVEMMRSDAWRDMSVNARRMLDLLEIEHLSHGGYENSNLIMTYDQFVAGGIRRGSISATIAELEELGWIEVNRGGYRGFARSWPHRFRLTHRRQRVRPEVGMPYLVEGTHDWRQYRSKKKNQIEWCRKRHWRSTGTDTVIAQRAPFDQATLRGAFSTGCGTPLYISGGGWGAEGGERRYWPLCRSEPMSGRYGPAGGHPS